VHRGENCTARTTRVNSCPRGRTSQRLELQPRRGRPRRRSRKLPTLEVLPPVERRRPCRLMAVSVSGPSNTSPSSPTSSRSAWRRLVRAHDQALPCGSTRLAGGHALGTSLRLCSRSRPSGRRTSPMWSVVRSTSSCASAGEAMSPSREELPPRLPEPGTRSVERWRSCGKRACCAVAFVERPVAYMRSEAGPADKARGYRFDASPPNRSWETC